MHQQQNQQLHQLTKLYRHLLLLLFYLRSKHLLHHHHLP